MPTNIQSNTNPQKLVIELHNDARPDNNVPFTILASVLEDMQQAFYLMALVHEGRDVRERARIPAEVERRYALRATVPVAGSYAQPAIVGDVHSDLFVSADLGAVYSKFQMFSEAVAGLSLDKLQSIVPDRTMRRRILDRFRNMIPKPATGWGLRLRYETGQTVEFDKRIYKTITELLKSSYNAITTNIVTGKLVAIDFDAHEITLQYPPTKREFVCYYDESIEERLIEQRREFIQITGSVTLDENDNPKKITDVIDIVGVDLSPFLLHEFEYDEYTLRFRHPLEITPAFDDSRQVFCLQYERLGIDVYATTREELDSLLSDEIDVLWRNYAREDPSDLTLDAQQLKIYLIEAIEEIDNATR